ncbi:uncharacterized protein MKK02DRAFT_39014 [Dioszegia hungarica]|uniref:F-box domain-containing protein n=1 Tax=Dioszegia hungarica TaxID=4972 RepID=A0AA38H4F5_9TREE|nr:uncharacterized protein MKK02DRAFT_39014 [Dioszegia hungarica]KAI9634337.1 hypothetical protein MKK02DRAFT_39014 [Dioszegia hungarica]
MLEALARTVKMIAKNTSTSSSRPPRTLQSLPQELISLIISNLDRAGAISLRLTSSAFSNATEEFLWRTIDLCVPPHYGELPSVQPCATSEDKAYREWAEGMAQSAVVKVRAALKDKMRRVALAGDERRMRMVEIIRVMAIPGAVYGFLHTLEIVSSHLKRLELYVPDRYVFDYGWPAGLNETLDFKLIDIGLEFPALTYVYIGRSICLKDEDRNVFVRKRRSLSATV